FALMSLAGSTCARDTSHLACPLWNLESGTWNFSSSSSPPFPKSLPGNPRCFAAARPGIRRIQPCAFDDRMQRLADAAQLWNEPIQRRAFEHEVHQLEP